MRMCFPSALLQAVQKILDFTVLLIAMYYSSVTWRQEYCSRSTKHKPAASVCFLPFSPCAVLDADAAFLSSAALVRATLSQTAGRKGKRSRKKHIRKKPEREDAFLLVCHSNAQQTTCQHDQGVILGGGGGRGSSVRSCAGSVLNLILFVVFFFFSSLLLVVGFAPLAHS